MVACSVHAEKTAERTISPLIGTWNRDGFITKLDNSSDPQFTKLTFAPNGALKASYLAASIGAMIGTPPNVKEEIDTYSTSDASKLSIAEGTTHRDYSYRVSGSKLYLTPPGGGDEASFTKALSTELH
jgi:hypothetical protein